MLIKKYYWFKKSPTKCILIFLRTEISLHFGVPDNQISLHFGVPDKKFHSISGSPHSLMIPANSLLCSSSRNIKEFQRDLRFRHSQTVLFTIPPKSVLYFKEKKPSYD